jgi:hypothetical protein
MDAAPLRGEELPLAEIARFPVLAACLDEWRAGIPAGGVWPAGARGELLPKGVLPYLMLLDSDGARAGVRIAGEYLQERAGGLLRGKGVDAVFRPEDAATIEAAFARVAAAGAPSLAVRRYVALDGAEYGYVRLICPLARSGRGVDGFFQGDQTRHAAAERGPRARENEH